jgi:sugar phosphate isomerase/epimerase
VAAELGCPSVRVPLGRLDRLDTRPHARTRVAETLAELAPAAVDHGVTILVENGGDLATSEDLWFIVDAVSHPAVQCCWNPCVARGEGERPTISIPRLSRRIGLVRMCDASFDEDGWMQQFALPGEGNVELDRVIAFLRGVFFDGPLVFHWPKASEPSLPDPDECLPGVLAWLRERIDEKSDPLSAYKRDKHAPNYEPATATRKA